MTAGQISAFCDPPDLVTIFLVYASDAQHFDVRKALASGGALEDPAIGMAAAAFAGYLRDLDLAARRCD